MSRSVERLLWLVAVVVLGGFLFGPKMNFEVGPEKPDGPRLVAVVYESAEQPVPLQSHAARAPIEEAGHEYRVVDDDVVDGDGNTPAELELIILSAREYGLPALAIQVGNAVRVVDLPATTEEIVRIALE